MNNRKTRKKGDVNSKKNTEREAVVDEVAQLVSDFLLQSWLLLDKILPEQLTHIRDIPEYLRPITQDNKNVHTSYSNYMLFLCVSNTLIEKSSLTMGELSRAVAVPLSTATRMVDWMVDNNYAERLPDPNDRRIVRVALTEEGRNLSRDAKNFMFEHTSTITKRLPKAQQKAILINMKDVLAAWSNVLEKQQ